MPSKKQVSGFYTQKKFTTYDALNFLMAGIGLGALLYMFAWVFLQIIGYILFGIWHFLEWAIPILVHCYFNGGHTCL
jgi:hypothetical protein